LPGTRHAYMIVTTAATPRSHPSVWVAQAASTRPHPWNNLQLHAHTRAHLPPHRLNCTPAFTVRLRSTRARHSATKKYFCAGGGGTEQVGWEDRASLRWGMGGSSAALRHGLVCRPSFAWLVGLRTFRAGRGAPGMGGRETAPACHGSVTFTAVHFMLSRLTESQTRCGCRNKVEPTLMSRENMCMGLMPTLSSCISCRRTRSRCSSAQRGERRGCGTAEQVVPYVWTQERRKGLGRRAGRQAGRRAGRHGGRRAGRRRGRRAGVQVSRRAGRQAGRLPGTHTHTPLDRPSTGGSSSGCARKTSYI